MPPDGWWAGAMNGGATGSKGAGVGVWSIRGSGDAIMSLILLTATGV